MRSFGAFWGHFEGILGAICGAWVSGLPGQPIGLDWVVLGDGSVGLGTLWGHFGDILGTCWGRFGDIEVLGSFWGRFRTFREVLGHFGDILRAFWGLFVGLGSVGCQVNPLG